MPIQFFDETKGLTPETMTILNEKIAYIKQFSLH